MQSDCNCIVTSYYLPITNFHLRGSYHQLKLFVWFFNPVMQWMHCNCCSFSGLKAFSVHSRLKFNTLKHYSETTLSAFQEWYKKQDYDFETCLCPTCLVEREKCSSVWNICDWPSICFDFLRAFVLLAFIYMLYIEKVQLHWHSLPNTSLSASTYHKFFTRTLSRNSRWEQAWEVAFFSWENNFLAGILYTCYTCQFPVWIWSTNTSSMKICVPEAKLEAGYHWASWGMYPSWIRFKSVLTYKWAVST